MAEEDAADPRPNDDNDNIFDIFKKETPDDAAFVVRTHDSGEDLRSNAGDVNRDHHSFRNLPGLQLQCSPVHANSNDVCDEKLSPEPKKPKLIIPSNPQLISDQSLSPESNKRRRVQHNYRRLSSSGYVDDYEAGKRFANSDAESVAAASRPRSPRTKSPVTISPIKMQPETKDSHSRHGDFDLKLSGTLILEIYCKLYRPTFRDVFEIPI